MKRVAVIGSGFAGIAAASCLARRGYDVTVYEKNATLGGRAQLWEKDGFRFDLGPSWYWMPDVFEEYFARFGTTPGHQYTLKRLDPSYRVFLPGTDSIDVPARLSELVKIFEAREPGSGKRLQAFLKEAAYTYKVGMGEYVRKPSVSLAEYADPKLAIDGLRLRMFSSMRSRVAKVVKDDALRQILEFPVLFLGGTAREIPAMYSLMNHADLVLGTWYPQGGMRTVVDGMLRVAETQGVKFKTKAAIHEIRIDKARANGVLTEAGFEAADAVVAAADYRHVEQYLVDAKWRTYHRDWWDKQVLSPSSLLVFLGVRGRVGGLEHHNLFFDEGLDQHADQIYVTPQWPDKPLFYACVPSKSDDTVAPEGDENIFLLVPLAPGMEDTDEQRERIFDIIMDRLEQRTGESIRDRIVVKRTYAHKDFINDYNSFKGNAYGLANVLKQTAIFKPRMVAKKVPNLFYAGQMTVPGPGVPPSLLSGQMAADLVEQYFAKR